MWKNTAVVTDWFSNLKRKQQCTFFLLRHCGLLSFYHWAAAQPVLGFCCTVCHHLPAGQGSNPSCQTVHAFWAGQRMDEKGHRIARRNHGMLWWRWGLPACWNICSCDSVQETSLQWYWTLQRWRPWSSLEHARIPGWLDQEGRHADFWGAGVEDHNTNYLKVADFLDVTLNQLGEILSLPKAKWPSGLYPLPIQPPPPPPSIIKNLPASISRHLMDISSDETAFGDAKPMYDKALADSGFCEMTVFPRTEKAAAKRENGRTVVEILSGSTLRTARMFQRTSIGDSVLWLASIFLGTRSSRKSSTSTRWSWVTVVCPIWQLWSVNTTARSFRVGRLLAKTTRVGGHVTAVSRRTARWMAHAKYGQWCTRQPSRRQVRRGITLVWPRKPSSSVIMRTSIRRGITDTITTRHCRSTSSGACCGKPKITRTPPKGVTCAWLRSSRSSWWTKNALELISKCRHENKFYLSSFQPPVS